MCYPGFGRKKRGGVKFLWVDTEQWLSSGLYWLVSACSSQVREKRGEYYSLAWPVYCVWREEWIGTTIEVFSDVWFGTDDFSMFERHCSPNYMGIICFLEHLACCETFTLTPLLPSSNSQKQTRYSLRKMHICQMRRQKEELLLPMMPLLNYFANVFETQFRKTWSLIYDSNWC